MDKYHVALSFAGEDREYVERVATRLTHFGVKVFYDKFEETTLWGKDLYTYLSDVYQNHAIYTVMFISEAYKKKLWTNHERMSAQARAFSESKEYILPAFFNEAVEVPGVLKTTGRISLVSLTPEELAEKITKKLRDHGVLITVDDRFRYPPTLKQISTSLSPTMIRLRKSSVLSSLPIGIFRVRRSTRYFSSTGPSSLQIKFSF